MRRWLLALLLTAAAAPLASARDALAAIDACRARLDAGLDVGFTRIAERCPDLAPSLAGSPAAAWLPPDWDKPGNELSAAGLAELRTLLTRQPAAVSARAPRVARVAAVLAGLAASDHRQRGWWARFRQWLREVLARRPPEEDSGWLKRLLSGISLPQAVTWSALAGVIALAAAIVVNELRIAGFFGRSRRRSAPAAGDGAAAQLTLWEVERAAPVEQPRLLLELIVIRLREQDRLPPPRALTVHELNRVARLEAPDRERLHALTTACERVRFGPRGVAPPTLAAALARGRELLGALEPQPLRAAR
jgi:uncharacterized protein DUF4129